MNSIKIFQSESPEAGSSKQIAYRFCFSSLGFLRFTRKVLERSCFGASNSDSCLNGRS